MGVVQKYWHTLRPLRPVQFYGRLWFRIRRPRPDLRPAPALRTTSPSWQAPLACPVSMTAETDFCFLGTTGSVRSAADWNDPGQEKLWLYNLHYFDDLNARDAKQRTDWHQSLIARWIADNPPGHDNRGGNGWEPYPLSLRIVNWIKWALAGNDLSPEARHSLAVQIRYLAGRLEWHLLGNHLFTNAKALVFAGMFFSGKEADQWRRKGLKILAREIPEQVLPDGGHFELSPMYHAIILEDILDLINLAQTCPDVITGPVEQQCPVTQHWRSNANDMRTWLQAMSHPDGKISFFNDAAFGIASETGDIEDYARRLGPGRCDTPENGVTRLGHSGYIRVGQDGAVALLDVGKTGPDYLPGHAHADSLSFELSLSGQRLFVNSGTSLYGLGPERLRQRATAAHNTLELDGENSSVVWGGFRVAQRATPFGLEITEEENHIAVSCSHDGYKRLPGQPVHKRTWQFRPGLLSVRDNVSNRNNRKAVIRYHLHPDIHVENNGSNQTEGVFHLPSGQRVQWQTEDGQAIIRSSTWHPGFGLSVASQCLEITLFPASTSSGCITTFSW